MKRTTLTIDDDDLLKRLKAIAAQQSRAGRPAVAPGSGYKGSRTKLELGGWDAQLQPGVDILDRDKLFDLMNGR